MKQGEDQKMRYLQCIKTYYQNNNDAQSATKYGFLLWPDNQIVALCAHCTRIALEAPPNLQFWRLGLQNLWPQIYGTSTYFCWAFCWAFGEVLTDGSQVCAQFTHWLVSCVPTLIFITTPAESMSA